MSDDTNKKDVQTDNHYSVTKEAYTNLAEKYQDLLQVIAHNVDLCGRLFDEAFTKHRTLVIGNSKTSRSMRND